MLSPVTALWAFGYSIFSPSINHLYCCGGQVEFAVSLQNGVSRLHSTRGLQTMSLYFCETYSTLPHIQLRDSIRSKI